jgi:hypothetical protein
MLPHIVIQGVPKYASANNLEAASLVAKYYTIAPRWDSTSHKLAAADSGMSPPACHMANAQFFLHIAQKANGAWVKWYIPIPERPDAEFDYRTIDVKVSPTYF